MRRSVKRRKSASGEGGEVVVTSPGPGVSTPRRLRFRCARHCPIDVCSRRGFALADRGIYLPHTQLFPLVRERASRYSINNVYLQCEV